MSKRYALIYTDGSMNVHADNSVTLTEARRMLGLSGDDPDTELVEIEVKVLQRFGPKEVEKMPEHSVACPVCKTEEEVS